MVISRVACGLQFWGRREKRKTVFQVIVTWKDLGTRLVRTKPPSLFRSSATMAQLLSRSVLLTNYHTEHLVCTASLIVSGRDHQKPGVSKPMKGQGLEGSK